MALGFSKGWKIRSRNPMKRLPSILLIVIAIAGFWLAGELQPSLIDMRRSYRLDQADPLENSPPLVAFTTVALGGFRGIIADILWIRASKLQEEGRYFEIVQLADWITKLEPRFSQVWAFHAWNLAYNVSVMLSNPEDRWRWVRSGISLLRDEGLKYNAGDAQLYRELGWLFQHKIGAQYDQAHLYYKQAWAREMTDLLGGPHPDWNALIHAQPGTPEFATRQRMLNEYKLDPTIMAQVDAQLGPLDWRLPQTHAIYWAWRGREFARGFEAVAAERMIFQSMNESFFDGLLYFDPASGLYVSAPAPDLLPQTMKAYHEAIGKFPDQPTFHDAYRYFLREAVVILSLFNRQDAARTAYDELCTISPDDKVAEGIDGFVRSDIASRVDDLPLPQARSLIDNAAYQSYSWKALGNEETARGYDALAHLLWKTWATLPANRANSLPPISTILDAAFQHANSVFTNTTQQANLGTRP